MNDPIYVDAQGALINRSDADALLLLDMANYLEDISDRLLDGTFDGDLRDQIAAIDSLPEHPIICAARDISVASLVLSDTCLGTLLHCCAVTLRAEVPPIRVSAS
jgi:hypothetical protein